MLLIPIVLICIAMIYYFYKRHLNTKFQQEIKQKYTLNNEQLSTNDDESVIEAEKNDSTVDHHFMQ